MKICTDIYIKHVSEMEDEQKCTHIHVALKTQTNK